MQTSGVGFFTVQFETFRFRNHFRSRSSGHGHCASKSVFEVFYSVYLSMFSRVCHCTPEFAPKFQRSFSLGCMVLSSPVITSSESFRRSSKKLVSMSIDNRQTQTI